MEYKKGCYILQHKECKNYYHLSWKINEYIDYPKSTDDLYSVSDIVMFIPIQYLDVDNGKKQWDELWKKETFCFVHIQPSAGVTPAFFKIDLDVIVDSVTNIKYKRKLKINRLIK